MTTNKEMERIVRSWLEPGLTTLTDDVLDPVLDQLPATPQRRRWSARRIRHVGSFAKVSLAAAALVVVAIVGLNLASRSGLPVVGGDPASPSPSVDALTPPSNCVDLYAAGGTYRATVGTLGVTATVPAGWHGLRDQFYLLNARCIFGGSTNLEVALVNDVYADACDWRGTDVKATTPAAVTAALAAQVGHDTIGPTDVTLGGYPGSRFEFIFPADFDDDTACDDGTMWLFPGEPDPGIFNIDPGTAMSVHVVDVDGLAVVVAARIRAEDATPAAISETEDIVDSLRFEPGEVEVTSPPTAPPSDAGSGSLPALDLPGARGGPAGLYGWEGGPRESAFMHKVLTDGESTVLHFAVGGADCPLVTSADQQVKPVRIAGLDGVSVEPYEPLGTFASSEGDETTRAHEFAVGDRTLCVFLTWHQITTADELEAAAQVVESIRAEPIGENRIRITFTLDGGWDSG